MVIKLPLIESSNSEWNPDPIYNTRARLVQGEASTGLQSGTPHPQAPLDLPSVPGFWLKVFQSSSLISRTITKSDEEILRFCKLIFKVI